MHGFIHFNTFLLISYYVLICTGSWGYREADPTRSPMSGLRQTCDQPKTRDKCCYRRRETQGATGPGQRREGHHTGWEKWQGGFSGAQIKIYLGVLEIHQAGEAADLLINSPPFNFLVKFRPLERGHPCLSVWMTPRISPDGSGLSPQRKGLRKESLGFTTLNRFSCFAVWTSVGRCSLS